MVRLHAPAGDGEHAQAILAERFDLPVMTACAFSATPGDGHALVQRYATFITERHGGRGAVREACEFILDAQGKLAATLAPYLTVMTSR